MADVSRDSSYLHFLRQVGEEADWQIIKGPARYFADNYCVGQMYCGLYARDKDPVMIADLKRLADTLIARPHTESLKWQNNIHLREWAWCDGLFMGPPSLAMLAHVTGERKYMDLVDKLWWKTTDYLYDPAEHLYYRDSRYFDQREDNGKKVFWSRGNGWVMGGLVRVLTQMPKNYPDRSRWVGLYQDMARTIAALQQSDGTWHASLLDPESYPIKETSGTGFFCYALAWGINHRLLDAKQYGPVVWKAWDALVSCVHPDGMLGYAQAIGAAPEKVTAQDTEVYAVGAFLLAGRELLTLSGGKNLY
jgi:rhamnogalacturonyl hydrolase YesR